jgi:hypothetical protein
MKPQCVLLRFWHLNQPTKQYNIKYFEITNCVRKTHWKGASNKKSIRWICCLRARVNDASDYQWGVRLSTEKICAGAVDLLPWIPEPSVNNKLKVETSWRLWFNGRILWLNRANHKTELMSGFSTESVLKPIECVALTFGRNLSTNCKHVRIAICSRWLQFARAISRSILQYCVTILQCCWQRNTGFDCN